MLFWPILIIGLGAIAIFLAGAPGVHLLDAEHSEARAVYLTLLLVGLLAGGAGRMLIRGGARSLINAGIWMAIFSATIAGYAYKGEIGGVADRVRGEVMPAMALTPAPGEVELRRAWDGHYRADAVIDGVPMRLMVDTGASMVMIPYEDVAALGIDPEHLVFSLPVTTANGKSSVAPIRLRRVQIGDIVVRDVQAAVAHPGKLKIALLGMSFLDRLDETSFQRDRLILRQRGGFASDRFIKAPGNN